MRAKAPWNPTNSENIRSLKRVEDVKMHQVNGGGQDRLGSSTRPTPFEKESDEKGSNGSP